MLKRKSVVGIIFCTLGIFAVGFGMLFPHKGLDENSSSYKWEPFNVPDDWHHCGQVSLDIDISFIQIDNLPESLPVTVQNNSTVEIDFLYESLSLQKLDEPEKWLMWTSTTATNAVGAEVQKFLAPGDSLNFDIRLSDLVPPGLLTVGDYRLFFQFTYRTSENNDTSGPIDISYGYVVCKINIQ